MDIICRKLANEMIYAYHNGRFWRWDEGRSIWKESHLMAQKFERAKAALKTLTPEVFFSDGAEFALLDEYEISLEMTAALRDAKPCKNVPVDPVEEESSSDAPAACICSTCTCGGCKEECFGNCRNCGHPVQECNSYQTEGEKHLTPAHSEDAAEPFGNIPAVPSFDFSALGDLSQQAAEADQQFDLHYGAAQDEYLISCIYLARIHALTAKAGRYGGGTWTKWYESKGMSKSGAWNMVQTGESFNGSTIDQLKQLPELTRKDLNLIARSGCAGQLVEAAGDSQRVQELLAQIKAEKERANAAESHLEAVRADVAGLHEQNTQLKENLDASNTREEEAWKSYDKAMQRAKTAESQLEGSRQVAEAAKRHADKWRSEAEAARKQPIVAVVDKDEVVRQAKEMADGMTADLKAQLDQTAANAEADARDAYDSILLAGRSITNLAQSIKPLFGKLPGEQRENAIDQFVRTLGQIQGEVSRCL